jgi:hypothetical protein
MSDSHGITVSNMHVSYPTTVSMSMSNMHVSYPTTVSMSMSNMHVSYPTIAFEASLAYST